MNIHFVWISILKCVAIIKLQTFSVRNYRGILWRVQYRQWDQKSYFQSPWTHLWPFLSDSWGNRMQREWAWCGSRLLSDLCVETRAAILPYLTDHNGGSALLHQIMNPDPVGGPPLYIEPSFPQECEIIWMCVVECSECEPNKSSHLKFMTTNWRYIGAESNCYTELYFTFNCVKCHFSMTNYHATGIEFKSQATCAFFQKKALLTKVSGTDSLLKQ